MRSAPALECWLVATADTVHQTKGYHQNDSLAILNNNVIDDLLKLLRLKRIFERWLTCMVGVSVPLVFVVYRLHRPLPL